MKPEVDQSFPPAGHSTSPSAAGAGDLQAGGLHEARDVHTRARCGANMIPDKGNGAAHFANGGIAGESENINIIR